jgi:Zn-dependent alcohol dehydrogenase
LVSEVLSITGGTGVHISLDTTGQQKLAKQSWEFVRFHGKILQVGLANPEDKWDISMVDHMNSGKQIIGCVQGDAIPQKFAVELIKWYRQGKLPIEKIVTRYPVEQFKQALQDMREGTAIKPVLVWEKSRTTRI